MKNKIICSVCTLSLGAVLFHPNPAGAQTKSASIISLADLNSQLGKLQTEISATMSSLNTLKETAKKPADLSKAAADFDRAFNSLQARADSVRSNAVTIKACVKGAYDAWQKELTAMQNAKLREKAQDRFSDAQKEFDKIAAEASEAKEQVLPFVSELKDISIYLNADLSEEAVGSLSNTIWKLGNRSRSVNSSIEDLKEQINRTIKNLPQK